MFFISTIRKLLPDKDSYFNQKLSLVISSELISEIISASPV